MKDPRSQAWHRFPCRIWSQVALPSIAFLPPAYQSSGSTQSHTLKLVPQTISRMSSHNTHLSLKKWAPTLNVSPGRHLMAEGLKWGISSLSSTRSSALVNPARKKRNHERSAQAAKTPQCCWGFCITYRSVTPGKAPFLRSPERQLGNLVP